MTRATHTLAEHIASARNLPIKLIPKLERELENNAIRLPELSLPFDVCPFAIVRWDEMEGAGE